MMFESGADDFAPLWSRLEASGAVTVTTRRKLSLVKYIVAVLAGCGFGVLAMLFLAGD